jgi:hypothetical protein
MVVGLIGLGRLVEFFWRSRATRSTSGAAARRASVG